MILYITIMYSNPHSFPLLFTSLNTTYSKINTTASRKWITLPSMAIDVSLYYWFWVWYATHIDGGGGGDFIKGGLSY